MNRKAFVEKQGATCANWTWSWSFINEEKKFIMFGVWEDFDSPDGGVILGRSWDKDNNGRHANGYEQSRKHIERITRDDFSLLIFRQYARLDRNGNPIEPRKIVKIDESLELRFLLEEVDGWYAIKAPTSPSTNPEALTQRVFEEGEVATIIARSAERNPAARKACLEFHGYGCTVCGLSMQERYGPAGEGVIHVHHLNEMALSTGRREVDPQKDLVPVCPNCHAVIHTRRPAYSPREVRDMLEAVD